MARSIGILQHTRCQDEAKVVKVLEKEAQNAIAKSFATTSKVLQSRQFVVSRAAEVSNAFPGSSMKKSEVSSKSSSKGLSEMP